MVSCPCHNQLQPHEPLPNACPPFAAVEDPSLFSNDASSAEQLLFGTHPQSVPPPDPDEYPWIDLGGEA